MCRLGGLRGMPETGPSLCMWGILFTDDHQDLSAKSAEPISIKRSKTLQSKWKVTFLKVMYKIHYCNDGKYVNDIKYLPTSL